MTASTRSRSQSGRSQRTGTGTPPGLPAAEQREHEVDGVRDGERDPATDPDAVRLQRAAPLVGAGLELAPRSAPARCRRAPRRRAPTPVGSASASWSAACCRTGSRRRRRGHSRVTSAFAAGIGSQRRRRERALGHWRAWRSPVRRRAGRAGRGTTPHPRHRFACSATISNVTSSSMSVSTGAGITTLTWMPSRATSRAQRERERVRARPSTRSTPTGLHRLLARRRGDVDDPPSDRHLRQHRLRGDERRTQVGADHVVEVVERVSLRTNVPLRMPAECTSRSHLSTRVHDARHVLLGRQRQRRPNARRSAAPPPCSRLLACARSARRRTRARPAPRRRRCRSRRCRRSRSRSRPCSSAVM